ncbi:dTDP-glucose 4,6-dehydratase [subsurface metagenome]
MKKILVTGGAGFIGSNFVHFIKKRQPGSQILVLDKLTYAANRKNLTGVEHKFIKGDICDFDIVQKVITGVDWIVHFAAESHVDRSIYPDAARIFVQTNIEGTAVLLEAAKLEWGKRNKPKNFRFLYVGSDEEYGSIEKGSFSEKDQLIPSSPYSSTKASGSLLTLSFYKSFDLPVLVTRCTNNYGPYQHVEKFIPRSITNLLTGQKIKLYGKGENVRDWIFVNDHLEGIFRVLKKAKTGEIYNIGADQEYPNIKIAKILSQELGKDYRQWIEFVPDRPGHDFRYSVSIAKIKKLDWRPKIDLKKGLKISIDWYKNQPDFWQKQKRETEKFYQKIGR